MEALTVDKIFDEDWKSCRITVRGIAAFTQEYINKNQITLKDRYLIIDSSTCKLYVEYNDIVCIETLDITREEIMNNLKDKLNPFLNPKVF